MNKHSERGLKIIALAIGLAGAVHATTASTATLAGPSTQYSREDCRTDAAGLARAVFAHPEHLAMRLNGGCTQTAVAAGNARARPSFSANTDPWRRGAFGLGLANWSDYRLAPFLPGGRRASSYAPDAAWEANRYLGAASTYGPNDAPIGFKLRIGLR